MNTDFGPQHIVLIGFMGTGKSTVSQLLAEKLGCAAIDTDTEVERREGKLIKEIFAEHGEPAFRERETAALAAVLALPDPHVIATGGGAVLAEKNRLMMCDRGFVVALKADAASIIARVAQDPARPLLQGDSEKRVPMLLEERKHAYDFAHLVIDTTPLSAEEVVEQIVTHWRNQAHK